MQTYASTDWRARVTDSAIPSSTEGYSGKLDRKSGITGGLSFDRLGHTLTGPQVFKTMPPPLYTPPQDDGFSSPFQKHQFGLTSPTISLPHSYPIATFSAKPGRANAKQRKVRSQ